MTVQWLWLCMCTATVAHAGGAGTGITLVPQPAVFAAETTVLVNDVARKDRELGYKVKSRLELRPLYHQRDTLLLRYQLTSTGLYLRGKHPNAEFLPHPSLWDNIGSSPFYALFEKGIISAAYVDHQDPVDLLNYKKSLLSLFQFSPKEEEHNETDISGECSVLYEVLSESVLRKIKKRCSRDVAPAKVMRVARYTLSGPSGPLASLHAEELLVVGDAALGLKARAWHALTALEGATAGTGPPPSASLEDALAALPAAVAAAPLPMAPPFPPAHFDDDSDSRSAVEAVRTQLERDEAGAGAGGEAASAEAALRLVPALRRAPPAALRALLHEPANHAILNGVARAMGLAGTRAALAAVDELVQLRARDAPLPLATLFLEAFALSDAPEVAAVSEVLRVGEETASAPVGASALLAAAAAAATLAAQGDGAPSLVVKESLLRSLARCKEEDCSAARLRALANLRRADTVEALVEHVRRAASAPSAAAAALDALAAAPARAVAHKHRERLAHVALDERVPLEVRAAALQLALAGWTHITSPIAPLLRALHRGAPHELRRVFWQRLRALASRHREVRDFVARLHPSLKNWDSLALNGTSSVLCRETGWAAGGWRAALDSAQVAHGGLLRRGLVRLLATAPDNATADLLSVEMWTRGMEAFVGGGEGGETPAAGLAFAVAGVRMRGVTLFEGQAELLGHVWAGTGSSPTPALRAVVPLVAQHTWQPLAAGVGVSLWWRAAAALAVDAHAQVSLWWRTARAALELRSAVAAHARLRLSTAWGEVRADARSALEPRLRIETDADFYDAIALCVRVRTDAHRATRNTSLWSEQGGRRMRVSRARLWAAPSEGRTLALGAPNDAACRALRAAEPPPPAPDG